MFRKKNVIIKIILFNNIIILMMISKFNKKIIKKLKKKINNSLYSRELLELYKTTLNKEGDTPYITIASRGEEEKRGETI